MWFIMKPSSQISTQPTGLQRPFLTRNEAADLLGISNRTLRRYELAGMITSIRLNKRKLLYRRTAIEAMLTRFETGGEA